MVVGDLMDVPFEEDNYHPIAYLLAISFRFVIYLATSLQNHGEAFVSQELQANFDGDDYNLLNHVTLKLMDGTTHIDHIVASCSVLS